MDVTRRDFAQIICIAPVLLRPAAAMPGKADAIIERRVYDRAGAVPPASILRRCGIMLNASENAGSDVVLTVCFGSLAERVRTWDLFNSDPEWCAMREAREVRLSEIAILAPLT